MTGIYYCTLPRPGLPPRRRVQPDDRTPDDSEYVVGGDLLQATVQNFRLQDPCQRAEAVLGAEEERGVNKGLALWFENNNL